MVKNDMQCPKCGRTMEYGANGFLTCRCGWFESSRDETPYARTDTSGLEWVMGAVEEEE